MSNHISDILFGVVWLIVTSAIISTAVRQPAKHPHSGEMRLTYGWFVRGFSIITLICLPILITVLYFAGVIKSTKPGSSGDMFVGMSMALFFALLGGFLFLETMCVRVVLTDSGIDLHSPWKRGRFIRWDEIVSVDFSNVLQWFVITDIHHQKTRLHVWLGGIIAFCDYARRYLSYNAISGALTGFKVIDRQAGRSTL